MTEDRFIRRHAKTWKEFEQLLQDVRKKGYAKLDFTTLQRLDRFYRQVSSHLSYAQTYYPNSQVCDYLNTIVSSAHNTLYIQKKGSFSAFLRFYTLDIPAAIRKNWVFILLSTSFFMAGAIFSFLFIWFQSSSAVYFLPQGLVENMDIQESGTVQWNHPIMSGFIMTNNLYVALQAFVYGISAGVGTAYILLSNGLLLGALSALAIQQGQALVYWSLILPHGIIELAAIFLSGAAGLKIGYALIRPQPYRRKDALLLQARESIPIIGIVIPMLVIAGIIEGFLTPSTLGAPFKLAFAALTAVLLAGYVLSGSRLGRQKKQGI